MSKMKLKKNKAKRGRPYTEDLDYVRTKAWAHCVARHVALRDGLKVDVATCSQLEKAFTEAGKALKGRWLWSRWLRGERGVSPGSVNNADEKLNTDFWRVYCYGLPEIFETGSECKKFILPFWSLLNKDLNTAFEIIANQLLKDGSAFPPLDPEELENGTIFDPDDFQSRLDFYNFFLPYTGYLHVHIPCTKDLHHSFPLTVLFARMLLEDAPRGMSFPRPIDPFPAEFLEVVDFSLRHFGIATKHLLSGALHPRDTDPEGMLEAAMRDILAAPEPPRIRLPKANQTLSWDKSSGKREGGGRKSQDNSRTILGQSGQKKKEK